MNHRDESKRAKSIAIKRLAYRDRSRKEVADTLTKKGIPQPVIRVTLDDLAASNYINDERFAVNWCRSRIENKKFGKFRVRQELIGKGLEPQLVEKVLRETYHEIDEFDLAEICAAKHLAKMKNLDKVKQRSRVAQFLQRKGFTFDIVGETLNKLIPY